MPWTDHLYEDETALLGHSELTDKLIYRIAHERRLVVRLAKHRPALKTAPPTPEELAWAAERLATPEHVESRRLMEACHERGGHTWGPVQIVGDRWFPFVICSHCRCSMTADQLPLGATP